MKYISKIALILMITTASIPSTFASYYTEPRQQGINKPRSLERWEHWWSTQEEAAHAITEWYSALNNITEKYLQQITAAKKINALSINAKNSAEGSVAYHSALPNKWQDPGK